jgi:hypothetical protein
MISCRCAVKATAPVLLLLVLLQVPKTTHAFLVHRPSIVSSLASRSHPAAGRPELFASVAKNVKDDAASFTLNDSNTNTAAVVSSSSSSSSTTATSRLRRLKDLMWIREAREDVTAAEFALSVERTSRVKKRAVDYEKLLGQLHRRLTDMMGTDSGGSDSSTLLSSMIESTNATTAASDNLQLVSGVGMGSIVCDDAQRRALLERLLKTRQLLLTNMQGQDLMVTTTEQQLQLSEGAFSFPELSIPKEQNDPMGPGPKLYVRDDGTVDWDGALQDREALSKFGTAVWARINGIDPESIADDDQETTTNGFVSHEQKPKNVTAKIEPTPEIMTAKTTLDALNAELKETERNHIALLNSALSAGQAVATLNLASLEPEQRYTIRKSAEDLEMIKERLGYQTLIYELERIYSYLLGELANPALSGYIPLQDRLNVAEFGLLESQIEAFRREIDLGEFIDADVLAVVMDQLTDFKRRLGIDYYVTGLSFDGEAIRKWLGDIKEQAKNGLAFYAKGCKLFWNDNLFCLSLINRAAQGYTLKPREVRTLRYGNLVDPTCHMFVCFAKQ